MKGWLKNFGEEVALSPLPVDETLILKSIELSLKHKIMHIAVYTLVCQ